MKRLRNWKRISDGKIFLAPIAQGKDMSFSATNKAANILDFIDKNTKLFISDKYRDRINYEAGFLESFNIKHFDACHVVAASIAKVDYFITVDDRLLRRYSTENLELRFNFKMLKPDDFLLELQKWN